jgi:hypothetical protein
MSLYAQLEFGHGESLFSKAINMCFEPFGELPMVGSVLRKLGETLTLKFVKFNISDAVPVA